MSQLAAAVIQIQSRHAMRPPWHIGSVQSIQTSPASLTIAFSGSAQTVSGIRYLVNYSPTVGDWVIALQSGRIQEPGGGDWLVLGKVAQ